MNTPSPEPIDTELPDAPEWVYSHRSATLYRQNKAFAILVSNEREPLPKSESDVLLAAVNRGSIV